MADPDLQRLAQMLQKPPSAYTAETAPAALRPGYEALAPLPGATYGNILPFATGGVTDPTDPAQSQDTKLRIAMPNMVREGLGGVLDLFSGLHTGQVTPRAAETLALGGLGTGSIFAKPGSLASGGAPIRAYHGSPHDFERFDASKIGTGEGAQAYGHGLYFSENPSVAESYKAGPGKMYEVNIHADPARFLDWDKPLGDQTPVRGIISNALGASGVPERAIQETQMNRPGSDAYRQLVLQNLRREEPASVALSQAGIPGIRYLDQGSRSTGQGTSNYVVFPGNEDLIEILRKYMMGVPAPVAAPQQSIFSNNNVP